MNFCTCEGIFVIMIKLKHLLCGSIKLEKFDFYAQVTNSQ